MELVIPTANIATIIGKCATINESVCDIKNYNPFNYVPYGLTCYNASEQVCWNNTLCDPYSACGTKCIADYSMACANNQTLCPGFNFYDYHDYYSTRTLAVCGRQQTCYDRNASVCLNGTTICPALNARLCGSTCFNPDLQTCSSGIVRCNKSCNGTCYSNSQYCYNNTKVCNNNQSVCDIKNYNPFNYVPYGLTCYNASEQVCWNNTLCDPYSACGTKCIADYSMACANNQTLCPGFNFYDYHDYYSTRTLAVCGRQQTCYDRNASVCLNGTTICPALNARLCGSTCFNPDLQTCSSGRVRCNKSCNGTCYSNSQYCYNNRKVCNNNESVCDIKNYNPFNYVPYGLTCYNASEQVCWNNTLCDPYSACGTKCIADYSMACANNQTLCPGFNFYDYHDYYSTRTLAVCGRQQTCYDRNASVCLNGTTICPALNARLCGSTCFNPDLQTCSSGIVRCNKSCNGTCYSNSQYCYNNTKVCNNNQSVCDIKNYNPFNYVPYGLTCYNASEQVCWNNTLCDPYSACGTKCIADYSMACANNQTLCPGFNFYDYHDYYSTRTLAVCGRQQTCYDRNASVCLNGTTICPALNARLCGSTCFNPDLQTCSSGRVRCNKSCNGTCYSNSQYCYNNRKVCNNNESVCDIKNYNPFNYVPYGLTCYNASEQVCWNNTLCDPYSACGTKCIADYSMACANNQTLCPGFNFYDYHDYYSTRTLAVCGRQQTCYDRNASVCLNGTTICPALNARLCGSTCFQSRSTNMFEWHSPMQQVLQWYLLFQQSILLQ